MDDVAQAVDLLAAATTCRLPRAWDHLERLSAM